MKGIQMDIILVAVIIGALGGSLSAILAYLDGDEPFIPRKFINGLIRGAIGGVLLALGFQIQQTPKDYILLFLSAAGFDATVYRGTKIIKKGLS